MTDTDLTELDRRVLTRIQAGFPIEPRPYAALADEFGATEADVLASVRHMRASGVIRRIGAIFDSARLGYRSTLCAIAAPVERIEEVAAVISAYPNVTHNYEREDRYSVWFTVIAPTQPDIDRILAEIADVAEQLESLGVSAGEAWVLERTRTWTDEGVIRRFGAAIKHHKTGYTSNAMGVWDCLDEAEMERVGAIMAGFSEVSHCYQRPRRPTWPHDIYTMIHGRSREECEEVAERIRVATGLPAPWLLYSVREFKKASMRYFSETE